MTVQERAENRKLNNDKFFMVESVKEDSRLASMNRRVLGKVKWIKNVLFYTYQGCDSL